MNKIKRMLLNCEVDVGKCWYIYIINKIKIDLLFIVNCIYKYKVYRLIIVVFFSFY